MSGETAPISAPSQGFDRGWKSSSAALIAPIAVPVAIPCRIRAANSQPTPLAPAKASMATISSTSAAISVGRRPMWSEIEPTTSSAASSATAYTAKTLVSVIELKPHSSW